MAIGPDPTSFKIHPVLLFIICLMGASILTGAGKGMAMVCEMVAKL